MAGEIACSSAELLQVAATDLPGDRIAEHEHSTVRAEMDRADARRGGGLPWVGRRSTVAGTAETGRRERGRQQNQVKRPLSAHASLPRSVTAGADRGITFGSRRVAATLDSVTDR